MRVLIIGAGDVGTEMARILCEANHDVVVLDRDITLLERLQESLDVMTIHGDGSAISSLRQAGIEQTDLLLAVTGFSEVNILACSLAKHLGVEQKIARVRRADHFDEASDGVNAATVGVDQQIITELECANNIIDAILRPQIKETVRLSHPDAQIVNFRIETGSPLIGTNLVQFPRPDLLAELRFCAIHRYGKVIIPRGQTTFSALDEVYVAGSQSVLDELIDWATPDEHLVTRVVIAGANRLGVMLAEMLRPLDMTVTIIEPDPAVARAAADSLGNKALVLNAPSTDIRALREADVDSCDAFIGLHDDNERNIMSCIIAKRNGARKVIAITRNLDYVQVIAGINAIDCGFSPLISAINSLVKIVATERRQTAAILKRIPGEVVEFVVGTSAPAKGRQIADLPDTEGVVLAMIFRDETIVPATGAETLRAGDRICVLLRHDAIPAIEKLLCGPVRSKR